MPRLIWTEPALRDVHRLYRFLLPKNPGAARRAVKAVRARVKILASHPEAGRPVEDMAPEYREWLVDFGDSGYVVLYRFHGDAVLLLAVRHQREAGYS